MIQYFLALDTPIPSAFCLFYGDPGAGMFLWQFATAAAIGLLFYARTIFRRVRLLFRSAPTEPKITSISDKR